MEIWILNALLSDFKDELRAAFSLYSMRGTSLLRMLCVVLGSRPKMTSISYSSRAIQIFTRGTWSGGRFGFGATYLSLPLPSCFSFRRPVWMIPAGIPWRRLAAVSPFARPCHRSARFRLTSRTRRSRIWGCCFWRCFFVARWGLYSLFGAPSVGVSGVSDPEEFLCRVFCLLFALLSQWACSDISGKSNTVAFYQAHSISWMLQIDSSISISTRTLVFSRRNAIWAPLQLRLISATLLFKQSFSQLRVWWQINRV